MKIGKGIERYYYQNLFFFKNVTTFIQQVKFGEVKLQK